MADPPPQAVMGLLNYITATSLDEDYAHVSERRKATGTGPRKRGSRGGVVVLLLFGLLVSTAAVETARNATQSASSHSSLVAQVNERQAELAGQRRTIQDLRGQIDTLDTESLRASTEGRAVQSRLDRLEVWTGAVPVQGPGIRVTVSDAPGGGDGQEVLDRDLQKLVNGLWQVGAEAISVNGQRLSGLSAIRQASGGITVNYRHVNGPYVVSAIGNPDTMAANFLDTAGGQTWLVLKSTVGLGFDIAREDSLKLPAASRLTLRHAHLPEEKLR
ncbi:MAG: DUF881 domain-containing protein [Nocardioides sp.]